MSFVMILTTQSYHNQNQKNQSFQQAVYQKIINQAKEGNKKHLGEDPKYLKTIKLNLKLKSRNGSRNLKISKSKNLNSKPNGSKFANK